MEKEAPPPYSLEPQAPSLDQMYPKVPIDSSSPAVAYAPVPVMPVPPVPTTVTTIMTSLGPNTSRITCPHCHADVSTSIVKSSSFKAWLAAGLLCLFGCVFGCCLVPFCMDSCKVTVHSCPNCKQFISRYND